MRKKRFIGASRYIIMKLQKNDVLQSKLKNRRLMPAEQIFLAIRTHDQVLIVKEKINLIPQASYSTVLSLATFITQNFVDVPPPGFHYLDTPQKNLSKHGMSLNGFTDKLFQPWCDFLCQIIRERSSYVHQKAVYFLIETQEDSFIKRFKKQDKHHLLKPVKVQFTQQHQSLLKRMQKIFRIVINPVKFKTKMAIINFSTSALRKDPFHPKVHLEGLIYGIWFDNQSWDIFKILKNQIPSKEQLQQYDAVVLTGSSLSVNDNNKYVNALLDNLKQALTANEKLKVLGICFGHQAITKMFGGKVEKVRWIGGVEDVELETDVIKKLSFFKPIHQSKHITYGVSQFHSDQVVDIAPNFKIIATSASCHIQAQVSDDQRILSFQFHPEYISPYVKTYEKRLKQYNGEVLFGQFQYSQQFHEYHKDSVFLWRKVISNFFSRH